MVGRLEAPAVVVVDCCSRTLAWSPTGRQCIISSPSFFFGGNAPSHTITPRCNRVHKSRYEAPAPPDSQDRQSSSTAAGWRSAVTSPNLVAEQSFRRDGNTTNGQVYHFQRFSLLIQVPGRQHCQNSHRSAKRGRW